MLCSGTTTEASASGDNCTGGEGWDAKSVFLNTLIQKFILYTVVESPLHGHVPLSCVPLGRRCLGRTLKMCSAFHS